MNDLSQPLVLVIDDMPVMIDIMKQALSPAFKVKVATSGRSALKAANLDPRPDCILLDVMMPDLDGYEVCRLLREIPENANTPILMVTSKQTKKDEEMAFNAGANDFICKPVTPSAIREKIAFHLETSLIVRQEDPASSVFDKVDFLMEPSDLGTIEDMKALSHFIQRFASGCDLYVDWKPQLTAILHALTKNYSRYGITNNVNEVQQLLDSLNALSESERLKKLSETYDNSSEIGRSRTLAEFVVETLSPLLEVSNPELKMTPAETVLSKARAIQNSAPLESPEPQAVGDVKFLPMRLKVTELRATMVLKRAILSESGTTILPAGVKLTTSIVNKLHRISMNSNRILEPLNIWVPIKEENDVR